MKLASSQEADKACGTAGAKDGAKQIYHLATSLHGGKIFAIEI